MTPSEQLLREYAATRSEEAFRQIVERHLNLVFSTALRSGRGDSHFAEDVAQVVFRDLAAKAADLPSGTVLAGWLYRHTTFTASKMIRSDLRRAAREQESVQNEDSSVPPESLSDSLEPAMAKLANADRDVLVLRFFESRDLRDVGELLGISEGAAQKRVTRALEKLGALMTREGIVVSGTALAAALHLQAAAVPATLGFRICQEVFSTPITTLTPHLFGTVKGKLALLGLSLVVSVPLLFQQRALSNRKSENATLLLQVVALRDQLGQLEGLRAQLEELEKLRRENAELHKLRAEITALRQKEREDAGTPKAAEDATKSPAQVQVLIDARYVDVPAVILQEVLREIELTGIPIPRDPNTPSILSEEQARRLQEYFSKREGVDLLSAPKLTTLSGRQARIAIENTIQTEGSSFSVGPVLDVTPVAMPDHGLTELTLEALCSEFIGMTEQSGQKIPKLRVRKASSHSVVRAGESVLLATHIQANADGTVPEEPRKLLVLVSSALINPDGTPFTSQ